MKRELILISLLVMVLQLCSAGCRHQPAYNEIDANAAGKNQNKNSEAQPLAQDSPAAAPQTPPASPQAPTFQRPSFMDPVTGNITDLPNYPRAVRANVMIGPNQGLNTMSLAFTSSDPMDKIAAFYDKTFKDNRWTIVNRIVDPDISEWTVKKGDDNAAKVSVRKDPQTKALIISVVRSEKLAQATK